MDTLSDVLSTIHFQGIIYCQADLTAPWGLSLGAYPGHTGFLMVVRGGCFLKMHDQNEFIPLGPGDLLLSPMGCGYSILDAESTVPVDLIDVVEKTGKANQKIKWGGGGTLCNLIMGCFQFETSTNNQLLKSLPNVLHIKPENLQSEPWLDATFRFLAAETANDRPGSSSVINHLTDLLFIQTVRAYITQLKGCAESTGFLKALSDPQIGQALNLIHADPQLPWTVASLASAVGMSRSSFAAKFSQLMECSPLEYITSWRMQKAQKFLREDGNNPSAVASLVGYQSEAAFRKAFKRETGRTPGNYKKLESVT